MKNPVLDRLKSYFDEYILDATKPTAMNLFLTVVSILALDIFRSVRFAHRHMLSKLSDTSLNAYYYVLRTDRVDHESLGDATASKALRVVPVQLKADYAFLLHGFYHLKHTGTMAIVLPHGVLFRGAAKGTIRQILLENGSFYKEIIIIFRTFAFLSKRAIDSYVDLNHQLKWQL